MKLSRSARPTLALVLPPLSLLLAVAVALPACSDDSDPSLADGGVGDVTIIPDSGVRALELDEVLDACIRASACSIKVYPALSNCLGAYLDLYRSQGLGPIYDKLYACVNAAKGDCAAINACFKQGGACDSGYKAACKGEVAVSCDLIEKRVYEIDCAVAGLSCGIKTGQTFNANCTPGPCDTSYSDTCSGFRLLSCSSGVMEIRDCAATGLNCGYGGWKTKTYACQGETVTKCFLFGKTPFKASCSGTKALTCVHDQVHEDDCSKHTHVATVCKDGACVKAGTACDSEMNRCSGDKVEACLDGVWKAFDCKALGLGPCQVSSSYGANCSKPAP